MRSVVVEVDRESVAAGDDVVPHRYEIRFRAGSRLSVLLDRASPDVRVRGWSWVAVTDGHPAAVWSVDHGVQMLVPDTRVTATHGPYRVFFRYFRQIDPAWLYRRLASGAAPKFAALDLEYQPIASKALEREERRREDEISERLLSAECAAILDAFGASMDLHNDRTSRFDAFGARWAVKRNAHTEISVGSGAYMASFRLQSDAERWLVAAVGAEMRASRGALGLPRCHTLPSPPLESMPTSLSGALRWKTVGSLDALLTGEDAFDYFQISAGRSLPEIAELFSDSGTAV